MSDDIQVKPPEGQSAQEVTDLFMQAADTQGLDREGCASGP
ncbi:hypothetical protein ACF068_29040 [Streptomyces sp. NPDC016309]